MKELSRRAILTAVGLGGAAALSGCGLANSSRPAATATATSRSVKNVDGSAVNVPTNPKRVVTLSEPTTDAILALGLKPIGVVAGRGQKTVPNYLSEKAKNIPIMGSIGQPNFEAIGAQKPDLILVDGTGLKNNAKALATLRAPWISNSRFFSLWTLGLTPVVCPGAWSRCYCRNFRFGRSLYALYNHPKLV